MASGGEFKRLVLKQFPATKETESVENAYWKKFQSPQEIQQIGPVTHIDVCSSQPHQIAITTSTRIHLYNPLNNEITKTFSRFRDKVYSGSFRHDGKLLVAGGESRQVSVLDLNTRAILRTFAGHQNAVHCTKFAPDNVHVLSCSDDKTARYWDLATGAPLALLGAHKDYVRTCAFNPASPNVWFTGSYDHTVKLWDLRTVDNASGTSDSAMAACSPSMTFDHGAPVEATLMLPGGGVLMSAGANVVKVWDLLSGGKLLHTFSSHQKTITSLSLDGTGTRLLTGSLDGHLKIYDMKTYEVTHGFKYRSGLLAFGMTPTNSHLVTGSVDGMVTVRRRTVKKHENQELGSRQAILRGGSYQYFLRGKNAKPSLHDFTVATTRHKRIAPYDRALRKFEYAKALNEALETRSPVVVASMLEELRLRVGLTRALSGRDEDTLEPLLSFLVKYVTDPKYTKLLVHVCVQVCDLYAPKLGQSVVIDGLFVKLAEKIQEELKVQKQIYGIVGMMDLVMAGPTNDVDVVGAPVANDAEQQVETRVDQMMLATTS